MFKNVQRRLTLLYTATTGAILIILLGCVFLWNISRKEQEQEAAFQGLWFSVSSRIQYDQILNDSYIAQTEFATRSVIQVEENGTPFLFPGAWTPQTPRELLIQRAYAQAGAEGVSPRVAPVSSSAAQTSVFQVRGEKKDAYRGRLIVIATRSGVKSLLLLSYIIPHAELLRQSFPLFFFSCAAGLLCILSVSWFFTGWSLRPARESAKKQADFIAAASHELRSPLAVIRAGVCAVRALEDGSDHSAREALLAGIDRECSRMARLVSDLLFLASSDAGHWSLNLSEVEADTLLIEAYEAFLPVCQKKGQRLSLELPEEPLPRLHADRQRIEQVLSILLDNASSYTPQGGTIRLKAYGSEESRRETPAAGTRRRGQAGGRADGPNPRQGRCSPGFVTLEIEDNGPGIPDEKKKAVFDRFYRADASRNDKSHFGLGLPIAKELVELHGGAVTVLDSPAGGSRFIIRL